MISLPADCTVRQLAWRLFLSESYSGPRGGATFSAFYKIFRARLCAVDKSAGGTIVRRVAKTYSVVDVAALVAFCPGFFAREVATSSEVDELAERVTQSEAEIALLKAQVRLLLGHTEAA